MTLPQSASNYGSQWPIRHLKTTYQSCNHSTTPTFTPQSIFNFEGLNTMVLLSSRSNGAWRLIQIPICHELNGKTRSLLKFIFPSEFFISRDFLFEKLSLCSKSLSQKQRETGGKKKSTFHLKHVLQHCSSLLFCIQHCLLFNFSP